MDKVDAVEAVRLAKEAVAELDEPYKMEAFKLVLEKLMTAQPGLLQAQSTPAERHSRERTRSSRKRAPAIAKAADKPRATTSLSLSVKQLEDLKAFYTGYDVKGGEICAFLLGAYIQNQLKQKDFDGADVEHCYRQLISLKAQVPAVKNFYTQLVWLVAPSRKKEWLRKNERGRFELTNSGLIALNNLPRKAK
jgi:hypothetical protein